MDYFPVVLVVLALTSGGVLKGAIGAGAPLIAVPLVSLLYDVPLAVALFTLPNLILNVWQGWRFRAHLLPTRFILIFAISGALGAGLGTALLASLPSDMLIASVALFVFFYIGLRIAFPDWTLSRKIGFELAGPAGFLGGIMQGACGISAPVSVTYFNAMRLNRLEFIASIATFFATMSVVQIIGLSSLGILTPNRLLYSLLATIPLLSGMPVGAKLAQYISKDKFDKIILVLLAVISLRLLYGAFAP